MFEHVFHRLGGVDLDSEFGELTAVLEPDVVALAARFGDDPVGLARLSAAAALLASRGFDSSLPVPLLNSVMASLMETSRSLACTIDVVTDRWDRSQAWGYDGAVSGSAWLSSRFCESRSWTGRQVSDAHRLTAMPLTFAALRAGRISRSVALRLAEARDVLPDAFDAGEVDFLSAVEGEHARGALQTIRVWIARARAMNDSNDPDPVAQLAEPSTLTFRELLEGRLQLIAELDPHAAQIVKAAIENLASKDNDHRCPMGERLADGLVTFAQIGLDRGGAAAAQRPHVIVTVDIDDFEQRTNTSARYADGSPVSEAGLGHTLCLADAHLLLNGLSQEPLAMGRTRRLATLAQRLALAAQWGGCAFPGCDRPIVACDVHHEDEWDFGGNTDVEDMLPLCRAHHRERHLEHWTIWEDPGGTVHARHPDGHTVSDHRRQRQRQRPPPTQSPQHPLASHAAGSVTASRRTIHVSAGGAVGLWATTRIEHDHLLDDGQRSAITEQLETLWDTSHDLP